MSLDLNLYALLNPAIAFVAGTVASLHCVGMCGPLSCAMLGCSGNRLSRFGGYHLGRLVSYATLGALAAMIGGQLVDWVGANPAKIAPWAFAAFFMVLVLGVDSWVTRWHAKRGLGRVVSKKAYQVTGNARGLALGLASPLIPCGPLYVMLWVSTMSGSAIGGLLVMAAYALGTMPLMIGAQAGINWLSHRMRPNQMLWLRRGLGSLALLAVCARAFLDTDIGALMAEDILCR